MERRAVPRSRTGRVKGRDNQLHRARVLEVRIHSAPAVSQANFGVHDLDEVLSGSTIARLKEVWTEEHAH
jgi:hypothetical protein